MNNRRIASWSVASVCGVAVAAVLIGFVWLPSAQSDFKPLNRVPTQQIVIGVGKACERR